jgi:TP901 family phage tail tape measure protein
MAKIELNIVALGDFKSINTELASLKAQVDLLNKSLAGVGLNNNNNLTKQLQEANLAFKSTMLSTGQFTAQTVRLTSETDKFGQSLISGKLKLNEYFGIIKNGTANASSQMKALALEQTKLQNSIVMSDPTKQGVLSVYTPTRINEVANATKIAANMQNVYNLAVQKGTQELINWGKNTQWAGRQLTVGMGIPLMIFGQQAVSAFKDVNTELTRLQRLYGEGLTPPSQTELNQISDQVLNLGKQIAGTMGIAQTETVKAAANFAAMGRQGQDLLTTTAQTMRLSKLGAVSTADATNTVVALQNVYKVSTYNLADAVNFLSDIQKQTTMTLGDMTQAIPRVGPIMQQLGGTYKDTAVMLVAMREAGIPAAQAANAVKSAVASMIAPTKSASQEWAKYGINLAAIKNNTQGNPVQMIEALQTGLAKLSPLVREQLIEKLFGKFQFARVSALLQNFGQIGSQTQNALKIAGATSTELANLANQEMQQATSSPTAKYQRAIETIKANLIPLGQKIMEIATTLLNFGNSVAKVFSGLPGPVKTILGIIAGGVALSGPVIMFTGLLANFVGYLLKGLFALKNLATGTKTFGQLFTPEIIASQNAAETFSKKILEDAGSVDILNTAVKQLTMSLDGMLTSMNAASTSSFAKDVALAVPFIAPKLATGGFIPGNPSEGDVHPAMLSGGEAVIPATQAKTYAPFINAMIDGKLPGYEDGKKTYNTSLQRVHLVPDEAGVMGFGTTSFNQLVRSNAAGATGAQSAEEIKYMLNNNLEKPYVSEMAKRIGASVEEVQAAMHRALSNAMDEFKNNPEKIYGGKVGEQKFEEITGKYIKKEFENVHTGIVKSVDGVMQQQNMWQVSEGIKTDRSGGRSRGAMFDPEMQTISGTPLNKVKGLSTYTTTASGGASRRISLGRNYGVPDELFAAELNRISESQSPSRATKRAAKNLVDGAVQGIQEGKPAVTRAANNAFEEALLANQQGPITSAESEGLATTSSPGLASTSKNRFARIQSARAGFRSKLPGFMTGKFSGLGMGLGLQIASQFAGPAIDKLPGGNIANDAIQGASYGAFLGPEGAVVGAAFGGLFGGIKKLIDMEKLHSANAQATFKSSADAASMFGGTVQDTSAPVINLDKITEEAFPKMQAIKTEAQNFSDAISKLPKDNTMSLIFDQMKNTSDSKAAAIAQAFANTQIAIGNLDPAKAQKMIDLYLASTGHANVVGTPAGTVAKTFQAATDKALTNAAGGKVKLDPAVQKIYDEDKKIVASKKSSPEMKAAASREIAKYDAVTSNVRNSSQLSKTLGDILNPMLKLTVASDEYNQKLEAIASNQLTSKNALTLYAASLGSSDSKTKNAAKEVAGLNINVKDQIRYLTLYTATKGNSPILAQIMKDAKDPKGAAKLAADLKLLNGEVNKLLNPKGGSAGTGGTDNSSGTSGTTDTTVWKPSTEQLKYKKILEARVKDENVVTKSLNEQLKAYQLQVSEAKRLADYQQQSFTLLQDQKTALMSGNYLGAAEFKQASSALTVDYNATTKQNMMQATIDKVQLQADKFATALADLNDAIANQSHTLDASVKKVAGENRIAADSSGTGTITVQNSITISSLDNATTIAAKVAAAAQSGTHAGIIAAKKQTNGKQVELAK